MKKLIAIVLTVVLCMSLGFNAAAVSTTIEQINPDTDQPLDEETGYTLVCVNETTWYDKNEGMFCYTKETVTPEGSFYASVADGMYTTEPVKIKIPAGVTPTLTRDGETVKDVDYDHIEETGEYILLATGVGTRAEQILRFTILAKKTGLLETFMVPEGFTITDARLDGAEAPFSFNVADMSAEGKYTISYRCDVIDHPYTLSVEVDHTPPTLKLEAVKNNVAKGPVDISDLEPDVSIKILLGNREIQKKDKLTQSGVYHLILTDAAGNETTYNFRILIYFNLSAVAFALLLLATLGGLIAYLVVSRKKLRVR